MKKKVLIFYISRYSGHYHAATAIEKGILQKDDNVEIQKINALGYTNPILGAIINKAYLEIIKKKPEIWGNIYDNPQFMKKTEKARKALHKFNMSKIKKLMEKCDPHVVICTQAFPCGMIADYKRSTSSNMSLIGVLTDHAPHSYWVYDEVDYFVVPSEDTARSLELKGVDNSRVMAFGIPVDPKFLFKKDAEPIRRKLGFKNGEPVILIMGGTQGLGAVENVVKSLVNDAEHNYQLMVVTGSNKRLYSKLLKIKNGKHNIKVFSYVDNIDELMEVSDLIITKAGGLTTSEALVKGVPLIIVDPIPGHERMNTDYLVEKGAAVEIEDVNKLYSTINKIIDSSSTINIMREKVREISMPNSALDVADLAIRCLSVSV